MDYNGQDFTADDVEGITGIGVTLKKEEPNKIGKFGVGFKAVFAYTSTPKIECDSFSFYIDDLVCPRPNDKSPTAMPGRTTFTFPFNRPEKPASDAYTEIALGFEQFSSATLMFLRNIGIVRWKCAGGSSGFLELKEKDLVCRIVHTTKEHDADDGRETFGLPRLLYSGRDEIKPFVAA